MKCSNCGQLNDASEAFCGFCGNSLPQPTPVIAPRPTPKPVVAPVAAPLKQPEPIAPQVQPSPVSSAGHVSVHRGLSFEDDLSARLGDRESPLRQVLASVAVTSLFMALIAGMFGPAIVFAVGVLLFLATWPVMCFLMTGRWPFSRLLGDLLGPERSMRRSIVLTTAFSLPFVLLFYLWNDISFTFALRALVTIGIMFYLTGFASTWNSQNKSHKFVGGMGAEADNVFRAVLQHFENQQVQPLSVRIVDVLESGGGAIASEDVARRTTRLLEVTQERARVVIRSINYGGHLYLRWDIYTECSGLRFQMVLQQALQLFSSSFAKLFGTHPGVWVGEVSDIVFGAGPTTGSVIQGTIGGSVELVPSWVYDNGQQLTELAVLIIVNHALNPALERANRPERYTAADLAGGGGRRIL